MSVTNETEASASAQVPVSSGLRELFINALAEMYDAEKRLSEALPLVAKAAKGDDLKKLLEVHLKETQAHVDTVRMVAESMGEELRERNCKAMKGLIKETVVLLAKNFNSSELDAALIAAAQKIEHYEIASYGTLCAWAQQLGLTHEFTLLNSTLRQERTADELLTGVARAEAPLEELIKKHILEHA